MPIAETSHNIYNPIVYFCKFLPLSVPKLILLGEIEGNPKVGSVAATVQDASAVFHGWDTLGCWSRPCQLHLILDRANHQVKKIALSKAIVIVDSDSTEFEESRYQKPLKDRVRVERSNTLKLNVKETEQIIT